MSKPELEYDNEYNYSRTSVMQVPAAMKAIDWVAGTANMDIGGGKFNLASWWLKDRGVENFVWDPFSRSQEHNLNVLRQGPVAYDSATLFNVLNVIPYRKHRLQALLLAKVSVKRRNGKIYISVFEGNRTGKARVSKSNTWQANKKLEKYLKEIQSIFPGENIQIVRKAHTKYYEISL